MNRSVLLSGARVGPQLESNQVTGEFGARVSGAGDVNGDGYADVIVGATTYDAGQIDEGAVAQPVQAPAGVVPDFGGLEVTTSSTALQALTDAVLYLVAYPFECAEQLSSRILAVAALRDVLAAFEAEGLPDPDEMQEAVGRDIELLRGLQNGDGGFGFWRRGDRSWPFVSIHAAHALVRAQQKDFPVPEGVLERSAAYLEAIDERIPGDYPEAVRDTLVAYALHVQDLMGHPRPERARALVAGKRATTLSFEALGWILPTLSRDPEAQNELEAVRRRLANGVTETAEAAHFAVRFQPDAKRWYEKKRSKTCPLVAIRALAHKLARAVYFMMRD